MRTISLILGFLFVSIQVVSQTGSIEGTVLYKLDSSNLSGVDIIVEGTRIGASTDSNGYFRIDSLMSGSYNFEIHCIGTPVIRREEILIEIDSTTIMNIGIPDGDCELGKSSVCPIGNHTEGVIPIVYGLPGIKLKRKADKGKIMLAGCLVTECDPKWYCNEHKESF